MPDILLYYYITRFFKFSLAIRKSRMTLFIFTVPKGAIMP